MNNTNKTFFYLLSAILIFFSSCEKDNDKEIDKEIAIVKAKIGDFEIASVKYENSELELNESSFPATIPDDYLERIVERTGIIISDTQAKTGLVRVSAYNSNGECIGHFSKMNLDEYDNLQLHWYAEYIYSDRSFTKKGKTTEMGNPDFGALFDCSFEKGWNIMYFSLTERRYTTQKPTDKDFIWFYEAFWIIG